MQVRIAWLDQQWNKPDRTDHYLMGIMLAIRQILAKNPKAFTLDQQKIEFEFKETVQSEEVKTKKNQSLVQRAKAKWGSFLGRPQPQARVNELTKTQQEMREIRITKGRKLKDKDA